MKKKIPFELLSQLEPVIQAHYDIIINIQESNTFYNLRDREINSGFYFKIYIDGSKRISNPDKSKFTYEFKPINESTTRNTVNQGSFDTILIDFNVWLEILKKYNTTISIHDDNFLKTYSDYYFEEFKIVDDDAYVSPFNPRQQNLLHEYFEYMEQMVTESMEFKDEDVLKTIQYEIKSIKNTLSESTKNEVLRKLSKIWARIFKFSKKLAKIVIEKAIETIVKQLTENGVKYLHF